MGNGRDPWSEGSRRLVPTIYVLTVSLQLMIDDNLDDYWVYRRDSRIRRPVADLYGPASTTESPVLSPEMQLLYKSARPRDKDEADFHAVVEALHAPAIPGLSSSSCP